MADEQLLTSGRIRRVGIGKNGPGEPTNRALPFAVIDQACDNWPTGLWQASATDQLVNLTTVFARYEIVDSSNSRGQNVLTANKLRQELIAALNDSGIADNQNNDCVVPMMASLRSRSPRKNFATASVW